MSALDPVILNEVTKVASAVAQGLSPIIGMAAQFPSTKPLLKIGTTEWLRSGVLAPRESYPDVPEFLTLLGTTYGAAENTTFPVPVAINSVACFGSLVVVSTSANTTFVSKDRGVTWTFASGVASKAVFEANGFIYANMASNLNRTSNGDTWETCSGVTGQICGMAYGNGVYVAPSTASDTACWTSTDGVSFTVRTISASAITKTSVCFVNRFFLVSPVGKGQRFLISYDGGTWSVINAIPNTSTVAPYFAMAAGDKALAFTNDGIYESYDGSSWTNVGALPASFISSSYYPKCFYSDGLIGVFGTQSLLLSNNLMSFVSVAFAEAVPAAAVSGGYLVGGPGTAETVFYRRKLNRAVGSTKFVDGLYYRVE